VKTRKEKSGREKSGRAPRSPFTLPGDIRLWDALRARRRALAEKQNVPPYVVFHDATLAQMVERRPQTLSEMAHISGVGERKLEAFGADFVATIRAHNDVSEELATEEIA